MNKDHTHAGALILLIAFALAPITNGGGLSGGLSWDRLEASAVTPAGVSSVRAVYLGRNTGDKPVLIKRVRPSCDCTTAEVDRKSVGPGEQVQVEVVMQLKEQGMRRKAVYLQTDQGMAVLKIEGETQGKVIVEPEQLEWREGETVEKVISVRLEGSGALLGVSAAVKGYQVEVVSIKKGREFQLRVQPRADGSMVDGVLLIQTDRGSGAKRNHRVFLWQLSGAVSDPGANELKKEER